MILKIFTKLADVITFQLFKMNPEEHLSEAVHFFIEDTSKILVLMAVMIYIISWLRAGLDTNVVKEYILGKSKFLGYIIASLFGAITPFCSCSSIPLFITFTKAKIPAGITMSFLITSPMINEVAVVLLWGVLGWKITISYIIAGLISGILGGFFFDIIKSDRYIKDLTENNSENALHEEHPDKIDFKYRHTFAKSEVVGIVKSLWKWVIGGVAIGALFHGFIPESFISNHFGKKEWWTVPGAVLIGIPLYSSATGIIPAVKALIIKGLPVGTAISLMMSTVAASMPEFIMLSRVMQKKMLFIFFFVLLFFFTMAGYIFNALI